MTIKNVSARLPGLGLCLLLAVPAYILGRLVPIVGGAVFAILFGMILELFLKKRAIFQDGIRFCSKYVLQAAVVLLGFGLNLSLVVDIGVHSLPIILSTIGTSLLVTFALYKTLHIPVKTATLIGVGSSICGGSAVAATAPVIGADDDDVAQAISVIFFFNVLAAVIFPLLGREIGLSRIDGIAFGTFAGTAVNDTSSVTAAAVTWDNMWNLGTQTLDYAVTIKLTRTLAIIPITLCLALYRGYKARKVPTQAGNISLKRIFPLFILFFILASLITTIAQSLGTPAQAFAPLKTLSKFCIVLAMAGIGLNTDLVTLIKSGGKPLLLGFICWLSITGVGLLMMHVMGIWA